MDEPRPGLAGRRIALTRPEPGPLAQRLTAQGVDVTHVPLIAIAPATDGGAALEAALAALDSFDWLVVTSANGAERVGDAAAINPGVRMAAVGTATAAVLAQRAGRPVDLVPAKPSAEGLRREFPPGPGRVLLAQANIAGDRLASGLRTLGHEVVAVEAYATILHPPGGEEIAELQRADAVVLASGSAVKALKAAGVSVVPGVIVTIGPRTADVARANGLTVAAVADVPTDDAVIAALALALQ